MRMIGCVWLRLQEIVRKEIMKRRQPGAQTYFSLRATPEQAMKRFVWWNNPEFMPLGLLEG